MNVCSEDCSKLNTRFAKYICQNGKCVPDPSFDLIKTVTTDIEAEIGDDVKKLSPSEKSIVTNELFQKLNEIAHGNNPTSKSKIVSIILEGVSHIKNNSNKSPKEIIGLMSTALMMSPLFGNIFDHETPQTQELVGNDVINNLKDQFSLDPKYITTIIDNLKKIVSPIIDPSQFDTILSGVIKSLQS